MAAKKKSSGSKAPKKKAAAKKKAAPKKKAAAAKKAAPKKKAAAVKKAAPKREPTLKKQAAAKPVAGPAHADAAPKKVERPAGSVSSMDVNLGHVFAVRPRLNTSFRQHDFFEAKRALDEEVYSNIHEAARAVAEEALAITRGAAVRPGTNSRR